MTEIVRVLACKACLLGDFAVGKTSLVARFVFSMFDDKYVTTIGTNVSSKLLQVEQKGRKVMVKLLIWDLMGNPRFKKVKETAIRGAAGALIVCDVDRRETLGSVEEWAGSMLGSAGDVPWLLIVNNCDLKAENGITQSDASGCASRYGVPYFFTSAKTSENVEETFRVVAADFVSTADGTGVVHVAPGFGEDDYLLGRQEVNPTEWVPFTCAVELSQEVVDLEVVGMRDRQVALQSLVCYFRPEPAPIWSITVDDAVDLFAQITREPSLATLMIPVSPRE
jgi:small GTP-binding protein